MIAGDLHGLGADRGERDVDVAVLPIPELTAALADATSGASFIYRCLDQVTEVLSLAGAIAVVDDERGGRQAFNAGRRPLAPGWERQTALRCPPGIHTWPDRPDRHHELAAAHRLCTVAFRLDRLHHQSTHDPLTGLYNRRGFEDQLRQAVGRSDRYGWAFQLVIVDVNRFKSINDRLGHPAGDAVLRAIADRLRRSLRAGDTAARIGGDEFGLLLPLAAGSADAPLLRRLRVPAGESEPEVELSMGAARCPDEALDADALFHLADQRLYRSKRP